ncbi:MAG: putative secreted protein [Lachnospiraceae bacterium]|jgi:oligopeptide transport system substrate-binding protein|nr:putative secreted protein [Lachnospiraceae bacterium]
MKLKKLLATTLVLAMTASMFAGCGKKEETSTPTEGTTAAGTEATTAAADPAANPYPGTPGEGEITINIASEPPQLFTVTTTDTTSFTVIRHVIENLVSLDENDKVAPGVATDWTVSDDGLVYTFNLRQDMKWSNGEPVTANDFVFAWKSLLTPSFAADYAYFGYIFKNGQAYNEGTVGADELGFKALSDYQLEVTLENPASYFLDTLAFGVFAPLNEKAYNEFGEAYGTDADKMAFNGAYKISSWEHESKLVLEKNPDYYNAANIEIEKINMVMINDANAAMNAFKAGEVDVIGVNGEQSAMMKAESYPVTTYDDGSVWYLEYNLNDPYLANANLRKALTYAIDKQTFVDAILKNSSKPAVSFTAPAINGLNDKFANEVGALVPTLDAAKAKEYYDLALQELGVDSIELTMISDDSDTAIDNAAFVQEQLRTNLGIEITVESMPFKSRLERMSNKDFSIVFAGWGPDYNDPMTFLDMFETGNGNNHTSYTSEAYDALLDQVRAELDPATRMGYLMDLEKLLMEDMPIGPVYWRSRDYIMSGKIASGVLRTAFQDMNYKFAKLAK